LKRSFVKTDNPRLKIMGVEAFGIYGIPNAIGVLLDILKSENPPPYLRDEVVLALASILDIQNLFYRLLVRFLEDETLVETLALDEAESAVEFYASAFGGWKRIRKKKALAESSSQAKSLQAAVTSYTKDFNGARFSRWILELPDEIAGTLVKVILSEAVLDDELISHDRLRLLIAHFAARGLRVWTNRLKE